MRQSAWTERYKRERGPGPSVTVGVPFLSHNKCHRIEKSVTQQKQTKQTKTNVTDVLLGLPADRDGPCPTSLVLHRISHSFHRGCRIVRRTERLEQWWVDLDVSEHEADWACFACLGTLGANRTFFGSCE